MFKKKNKSFLITGGSGFIGRNIAENLVSQGFKVTIFDNNSRGSVKQLRFKKKNQSSYRRYKE